MGIRLYNTLSGEKEELHTLEPGKVRFYACGPTVYNLFHIGNGRMFVIFDTVRRYLEYRGYAVRYVQNFTDVDDRIIQRANETGDSVREVANRYIEAYFEDADKLHIQRAVVHPRVTECIPDIIRFIEELIDKGHAYEEAGTVYFDTSTFADYGKLSHQSLDSMQAGFRVDVLDEKHDATDFALWKAAKAGEEFWESPWGPGRPGWHIECSVMNEKYLGEQIDIHAGGRDLVFPHHENEIAQTEAKTGKTFARYWLHNGTLNINGEKMSKSTGNFIMTRDLLERRDARALRLFLLSAHYRHPLNYTEEALDHWENALARVDRALKNLSFRADSIQAAPQFLSVHGDVRRETERAIEAIRAAFIRVMDDDFNTAEGISVMFDAVRQANLALEDNVTLGDVTAWKDIVLEFLDVLGIGSPEHDVDVAEVYIQSLIEERAQARKNRDFVTSDKIRDELLAKGIVIEDTPQGTRWSKA